MKNINIEKCRIAKMLLSHHSQDQGKRWRKNKSPQFHWSASIFHVAYLLGVLQLLFEIDVQQNGPQVLILTSNRLLTNQIFQEAFEWLGTWIEMSESLRVTQWKIQKSSQFLRGVTFWLLHQGDYGNLCMIANGTSSKTCASSQATNGQNTAVPPNPTGSGVAMAEERGSVAAQAKSIPQVETLLATPNEHIAISNLMYEMH